ncbi:MAG: hypothetical protein P3B98_12115, partial [Gemmatimonadota bacterium]|nr:hypothetical protein [Gemmatimonadota bacterium]
MRRSSTAWMLARALIVLTALALTAPSADAQQATRQPTAGQQAAGQQTTADTAALPAGFGSLRQDDVAVKL